MFGFLLLFAAGISAAIYITGPLILDVYNKMVYPSLRVTLSVKSIIGMSMIFTLFKVDMTKSDDGKTLTEYWVGLISYVIFVLVFWGLSKVYCLFL